MNNPDISIPFNRPSLVGSEIANIEAAVRNGHTSCSGQFSSDVIDILLAESKAEDVLLTTSCTAALEMSALLLDIEPGDTVVVPSYGFVTTALAYVRQGATIKFCDIDSTTLGMDPDHLESLMDDTVRAVVPIHYSGIACEIDRIVDIVERYPRAELVEDNAHGLFGRFRDRPLGSFGRFSTLSFHETKNFICGEGGAIVLNRPSDVDRAHVLFDKGTNRRAFLHGHVDKYSWHDIGSSFGLSDVLAAYLLGQLRERDHILGNRQRVFDRYYEALSPMVSSHGIALPHVGEHRVQAYHMFYVLLPDAETRTQVMGEMNADGIYATFHYVPLHSSPGGQKVAAHPSECPVTDDISSRLLRLPFYTELADAPDDIERVINAFERALSKR